MATKITPLSDAELDVFLPPAPGQPATAWSIPTPFTSVFDVMRWIAPALWPKIRDGSILDDPLGIDLTPQLQAAQDWIHVNWRKYEQGGGNEYFPTLFFPAGTYPIRRFCWFGRIHLVGEGPRQTRFVYAPPKTADPSPGCETLIATDFRMIYSATNLGDRPSFTHAGMSDLSLIGFPGGKYLAPSTSVIRMARHLCVMQLGTDFKFRFDRMHLSQCRSDAIVVSHQSTNFHADRIEAEGIGGFVFLFTGGQTLPQQTQPNLDDQQWNLDRTPFQCPCCSAKAAVPAGKPGATMEVPRAGSGRGPSAPAPLRRPFPELGTTPVRFASPLGVSPADLRSSNSLLTRRGLVPESATRTSVPHAPAERDGVTPLPPSSDPRLRTLPPFPGTSLGEPRAPGPVAALASAPTNAPATTSDVRQSSKGDAAEIPLVLTRVTWRSGLPEAFWTSQSGFGLTSATGQAPIRFGSGLARFVAVTGTLVHVSQVRASLTTRLLQDDDSNEALAGVERPAGSLFVWQIPEDGNGSAFYLDDLACSAPGNEPVAVVRRLWMPFGANETIGPVALPVFTRSVRGRGVGALVRSDMTRETGSRNGLFIADSDLPTDACASAFTDLRHGSSPGIHLNGRRLDVWPVTAYGTGINARYRNGDLCFVYRHGFWGDNVPNNGLAEPRSDALTHVLYLLSASWPGALAACQNLSGLQPLPPASASLAAAGTNNGFYVFGDETFANTAGTPNPVGLERLASKTGIIRNPVAAAEGATFVSTADRTLLYIFESPVGAGEDLALRGQLDRASVGDNVCVQSSVGHYHRLVMGVDVVRRTVRLDEPVRDDDNGPFFIAIRALALPPPGVGLNQIDPAWRPAAHSEMTP